MDSSTPTGSQFEHSLVTKEELRESLNTFPEDQQALLALVAGGYHPEEIAAILDTTAAAVKIRLSRLRRRLKAQEDTDPKQ
ncbi:sigma factor-like helix-turn-helix DNA-binding protein [Micropruina sp.]|uniref:sigma factor-like helix-turn-helix DNA-binding protein n=1 Tax=Micropruina sp. TaxID=2737536 RepID=UPI0039E3B8C9